MPHFRRDIHHYTPLALGDLLFMVDTYPMPIPSRKRQAVSAESMPLIDPPPYDPALRAAKMKRMTVEMTRAHLRE